ncbi:VWA domain-containing protein [Candidatus Uhrbacteria bacterium]|nr:VWA domain-containing protein [Candidatus Uhrbacteria bacterium]
MDQQEEVVIDLGPQIPGLPLREVHYRARVEGLQSNVEVGQRFGNDLQNPVEAIYVFPLPDDAQVIGVEMRIGERRLQSELRRREEARGEYEMAREAGHHASLLEQERPNVFTMSVAGIEPGEEVTVITSFLAPVTWQDQGGRFRLPLVVAPRFIPGEPPATAAKGGGWARDTDLVPDASRVTPKVAETVSYTASVEVLLDPGFPAAVSSPTHDELVGQFQLAAGQSRESKAEGLRPDRDFIITYRTAASLPTVKVDRSEFVGPDGVSEQFLTLQLVAGSASATAEPLDLWFCLDGSGSMTGAKIAGLRRVVKKTIDQLKLFSRPVRVGLFLFDDHRFMALAPLQPIGQAHYAALDQVEAQGGTMAGTALTKVMALFGNEADDRERCVILISDGQSEDSHFTRRAGVRVHTVGLDSAVNDELLKRWARESGGGAEWIFPGEDYANAALRLAGLASGPVLRDVALKGLPKESETVGLHDLYASRPTTVAVKLPKDAAVGGCILTGRATDGSLFETPVDLPLETTSDLGAKLWARMRLREVKDNEEQTALSLRYGMVGPTTAFVAVSLKEVPGEKPQRVDIPVLLPHTWDYDQEVFGQTATGGAPAVRGFVGFAAASFASLNAAPSGGAGRLALRGGSSSPLKAYGPDSAFGGYNTLADQAGELDLAAPGATARPALLDQAERFLAQANSGIETEADWRSLQDALTAERQTSVFRPWSEPDRARLYWILAELQTFGYRMEIPTELESEPVDVDARRLWLRARESLGHAVARP